MSESATLGQFTARFVQLVGLHLAVKISRSMVAAECKTAWGNGWRDAEWFAGLALMGTDMDNVHNPAAMFTTQLRESAAMVCPVERTPQPPPIAEVVADINRGHQPAANISQYVQKCRQAINGETA